MPDTPSSVVGAYTGTDPYDVFVSTLKWISETKQKIPLVTQATREESFQVDPLLRGTVVPFLKNYLLSGGSIVTADNKLYRGNGTSWVASTAAADITGTLSDAQIAALESAATT